MDSVKLNIADIIIEVETETANLTFTDDQAHKKFIVEDGTPHIKLFAHYGKLPNIKLGKLIFDSESVWKLYSSIDDDKVVFTLHSPPNAETPYSIAVIDKSFRKGEIYLSNSALPEESPSPNPLNYPLDELIMLSILSKGYGIILHSACVSDNGRGMLFTGTSGAGKSTISAIWKNKDGVTVLTDERVIIKKENSRYVAYGTPWHGTAKIHSPEKTNLDGIFFIKHGKENNAKPLNKIDAVSRFIARAFPTYWDKEGMEFSLNFASAVVENVSCFELYFTPDDGVVDYVRSIKKQ
ncbi:MAG: hypothetical protein D6734_09280 [Candidatus Schekmanbacteria bacterium]|nr:MAG: hypothetical protein D6734_09280 [Candidatus Schekmanbacteria bacterium]